MSHATEQVLYQLEGERLWKLRVGVGDNGSNDTPQLPTANLTYLTLTERERRKIKKHWMETQLGLFEAALRGEGVLLYDVLADPGERCVVPCHALPLPCMPR